MNIKFKIVYFFIILTSAITQAESCDPINTYCQQTTNQVCELTEDTFQQISDYLCVRVPDPRRPWKTKNICTNKYSSVLVPGSSSCKTITSLTCPRITGMATLSCDNAMNTVSACLTGNSDACVNAHKDALIASTFGPSCVAFSLNQNILLENTYETRLYNLIDDALYTEARHIFGDLLGDVTFDDYVRGGVAFYKTSNTALMSGGRATEATAIPGKIFFNSLTPARATIIHELAHIWQYRRLGIQNTIAQGCQNFFDVGSTNADDQYSFTLEANKPFTEYRLEQQAQIIETYFILKNNPTECTQVSDFQNCAQYSSNTARVNALKRAISGVATPVTPAMCTYTSTINIESCSNNYCAESFGRSCYAAGGSAVYVGSFSCQKTITQPCSTTY